MLMISFDETNKVLLRRAAGIGIDLSTHIEAGRLHIEQVDPADLSPGELSVGAGRWRSPECSASYYPQFDRVYACDA